MPSGYKPTHAGGLMMLIILGIGSPVGAVGSCAINASILDVIEAILSCSRWISLIAKGMGSYLGWSSSPPLLFPMA